VDSILKIWKYFEEYIFKLIKMFYFFIFKAVESFGIDIKQCAPGPPMDLIEERESSTSEDEEELEPEAVPGCSTTVLSTRPKHSMRFNFKFNILLN
jgi:hypothetical protein